MNVFDVTGLSALLPTLDLAQRPTHEEALAAAPSLGSFNRCELALARFSGRPPWERHPDDELIYVLDGALELTLLEGPEPETLELRAGSLLVVPRSIWHRSHAAERVTLLAATSADGNESSFADDPRSPGEADHG